MVLALWPHQHHGAGCLIIVVVMVVLWQPLHHIVPLVIIIISLIVPLVSVPVIVIMSPWHLPWGLCHYRHIDTSRMVVVGSLLSSSHCHCHHHCHAPCCCPPYCPCPCCHPPHPHHHRHVAMALAMCILTLSVLALPHYHCCGSGRVSGGGRVMEVMGSGGDEGHHCLNGSGE